MASDINTSLSAVVYASQITVSGEPTLSILSQVPGLAFTTTVGAISSTIVGATTVLNNVTANNTTGYSLTLRAADNTVVGTNMFTVTTTPSVSYVSFPNLSAGDYTVTITDANGCFKETNNITLTQPNAALASNGNKTDVSCNDAADGSINLSVSGGTANYTFAWTKTGDSSYSATSEDLNNLAPGTYNVTVTDANDCTTTASVTITQPDDLTIAETITNFEGKKLMIVSFLEGEAKQNLSPANCKSVGSEIAKMHNLTKNLKLKRQNNLSVNSWRKLFNSVKDKCENIHKDLPKLIEENLNDVEKNWPKNLPRGIIHADLSLIHI